ncbi:hypothetical protein M406DRAFT_287289 [Cryphonectria parasitica EP155]|uniref:F-box domain-containing protein n=1 Tax=Cryphonectria parasitica (strain ATCC 38755 / EP155) TaxID=660469 RepID=A0A9P4YA96_CRYP1|nr:uncharacterized protein M406DRAFT_287289 [Cryphonectria parasitica EP155]KAF3769182.1 hypothetical protein M406DRAFT_287289 [Cryphonectria parasitica EP155]
MDYEPPSPSYPYPDTHQPQDSGRPLEQVDERLDLNTNPRHISEIYSHDAISGAELGQDNSIISEYLRSRDPAWDQLTPRTAPLTLLELPVDVLRLVVKEVRITHTNDLTSLALTNSTLHNLAIPHIYSRFDIVWPDALTTTTEVKSVDALTYGLSTLCLGSPFARTTRRLRKDGNMPPGSLAKFAGNDYAKYTRKFSLGNGPNDWVSEYAINKESGKMLGTLVALAVSRMVNLETFIWDMPTGVLSDIFMALASLPDSSENGQCMLERVWIRWHDNSDTGSTSSSASSPSPATAPAAVVPAGSTLTPIGISLPSTASHPAPKPAITYGENHVEYPTFSVLPPLKSLTVLDIDELAYLDEMSVLIERSVESLQELRVGISNKAIHHDFVQTWDGPELEQVDHNARWPGESRIGERRLGGVLGVLVGRIYDIRRKPSRPKSERPAAPPDDLASPQTPPAASPEVPPTTSGDVPLFVVEDETNSPISEPNVTPTKDAQVALGASSTADPTCPASSECPVRDRLDGKLGLTTLELERVPLSMQVCNKAFDWAVLTNLTILECAQHENLWKLLKKQFQPQPRVHGYGISPTSSKPMPNAPLQYALNLKRLHTDVTSPALITFIRATLAPNSLETLFLQDRRRSGSNTGNSPPPVTIDTVFRGAIKRHRSSLRRLLLDSSAKINTSASNSKSTRWRSWCLPTEVLLYITSGRMSNLRELAVAIEYNDWHTFLQRLPNIPQLRSLHIPFLADHVIGNAEPKELVMQMTDIITLRPEIQLCYVGISNKCFEILENRPSDNLTNTQLSGDSGPVNLVHGDAVMNHAAAVVEDATDEDDTEDEDHDDEESQDEGTPTSPTEPEDTQSEHSYDDSDDDSFVEPAPKARLRLREILFYDDKVAIFKARHGRL